MLSCSTLWKWGWRFTPVGTLIPPSARPDFASACLRAGHFASQGGRDARCESVLPAHRTGGQAARDLVRGARPRGPPLPRPTAGGSGGRKAYRSEGAVGVALRVCALAGAGPPRAPGPSMTSAPRTVPGPRWRKQSLPEIRSARCRVGGFMSHEHLSRECGDAPSKPEVSQGVRPRALVPLLGRAIRT